MSIKTDLHKSHLKPQQAPTKPVEFFRNERVPCMPAAVQMGSPSENWNHPQANRSTDRLKRWQVKLKTLQERLDTSKIFGLSHMPCANAECYSIPPFAKQPGELPELAQERNAFVRHVQASWLQRDLSVTDDFQSCKLQLQMTFYYTIHYAEQLSPCF